MDHDSFAAAADPRVFVAGLWASGVTGLACLVALLAAFGLLHGPRLFAALAARVDAGWLDFLVYAAIAAGVSAVGLWLRLRECRQLQALRRMPR